ncbi:hypothetical protein [Gorillibacterium sp. sgz5001074]|uniref:hypothetical protein n=1 Tax=Gorillibacterium sp. sgz5001074 TaxID=3446695 RepID=UPI003F669C58
MYRQNPIQNLIGDLFGYPSTPGQPGGFPGGVPGGFPGGGVPGGVFPGGGYPGFPGIPGPGPMPGPGPVGPGPIGPGVPGPGGVHGQAPTGAPPSFVPPKPGGTGFSVQAVNPGAISACRFRYVYIWQSNGDSYWAYLTFVGRNSVAGYRWIGFTWVYFGLDLRFIDQFYCY